MFAHLNGAFPFSTFCRPFRSHFFWPRYHFLCAIAVLAHCCCCLEDFCSVIALICHPILHYRQWNLQFVIGGKNTEIRTDWFHFFFHQRWLGSSSIISSLLIGNERNEIGQTPKWVFSAEKGLCALEASLCGVAAQNLCNYSQMKRK